MLWQFRRNIFFCFRAASKSVMSISVSSLKVVSESSFSTAFWIRLSSVCRSALPRRCWRSCLIISSVLAPALVALRVTTWQIVSISNYALLASLAVDVSMSVSRVYLRRTVNVIIDSLPVTAIAGLVGVNSRTVSLGLSALARCHQFICRLSSFHSISRVVRGRVFSCQVSTKFSIGCVSIYTLRLHLMIFCITGRCLWFRMSTSLRVLSASCVTSFPPKFVCDWVSAKFVLSVFLADSVFRPSCTPIFRTTIISQNC